MERKVVLAEKMLSEAMDNIRGAVMICYPMGLPEWDLVRGSLENSEDLSETSVSVSLELTGAGGMKGACRGVLCSPQKPVDHGSEVKLSEDDGVGAHLSCYRRLPLGRPS